MTLSLTGFSEEFPQCAKMCKDSWFCKETFAPQQCRKGVVVLLHRGLTICFRRRPSLKHLTKNTKNTSRTCPRWGSPVFYIALVLAWNPGRSFHRAFCAKRDAEYPVVTCWFPNVPYVPSPRCLCCASTMRCRPAVSVCELKLSMSHRTSCL